MVARPATALCSVLKMFQIIIHRLLSIFGSWEELSQSVSQSVSGVVYYIYNLPADVCSQQSPWCVGGIRPGERWETVLLAVGAAWPADDLEQRGLENKVVQIWCERPVLKAGCDGHHKAEIDVAIIILVVWLWLRQIANIKFSRFVETRAWGGARGQTPPSLPETIICNNKPSREYNDLGMLNFVKLWNNIVLFWSKQLST